MTASQHALELLSTAANAADSKQGADLVALDVSEPLPLADIFLLVTGRNERNVVAIAEEIEDKLLEVKAKPLRREGRAEGRWVLLDFVDVVVHVQHAEEREFYALDKLWKDCPIIPFVDRDMVDAAAAPDAS